MLLSSTTDRQQVACQKWKSTPPEHTVQISYEWLTLYSTYDNPSFILKTFVPPVAQDAYLAIRAFNLDVASIADATSNPTVGAMRMQFWREAITKALAGTPPKEPVAILLAKAAEDLQARTEGKAKLSKSWFTRVINTRQEYLNNPPYPNLAALETYAENTYSTLLYLTLQSLPMASLTADHLASHIGKATGIATVLRGLPHIVFPPPPKKHSNQAGFGGASGGGRQGAVMLPLDVMADAGVREEEVFRQGAEAPGLRDAVFTVATRASDHLITAREMLRSLQAGGNVSHEFEHQDEEEHRYGTIHTEAQSSPKEDVEKAFGVLMPAVATQMWLDRLQKADFDVFSPQLRTTGWQLPWRSYWAFNRRKF
ncbi:hypothetical protein LTR39_001927 [Cryomyces antarcticus]|nr:hypothetical protein LTR39_001927 [Cryomyces antarcticus]